jgi:hypothetical protein
MGRTRYRNFRKKIDIINFATELLFSTPLQITCVKMDKKVRWMDATYLDIFVQLNDDFQPPPAVSRMTWARPPNLANPRKVGHAKSAGVIGKFTVELVQQDGAHHVIDSTLLGREPCRRIG